MSNVPFGHSCCMRCGNKECDIDVGNKCFIVDFLKNEEKQCDKRKDSVCGDFKIATYSIDQLIKKMKER